MKKPFDWKALRNLPVGSIVETPLGESIDWSDPTHVYFMVEEVVRDCGNSLECFEQDEINELNLSAINALPKGKDATVKAILDCLYDLPDIQQYLYLRGTEEYPYGSDGWEAQQNEA